MTEIGKSLIQEGKEAGMKAGEKKKAMDIAKKAILKGMDNETIQDITSLTIEEIEAIRNVID